MYVLACNFAKMRVLIILPEDHNRSLDFCYSLIDTWKTDAENNFAEIHLNENIDNSLNAILLVRVPDLNAIKRAYFYKVQLPKFIHKEKIECVRWMNGFCPKGIPVRSELYISDVDYLYQNKFEQEWQAFSKKHILESLAAASHIYTYSNAAKNVLQHQLPDNKVAIEVCNLRFPNYKLVETWDEKSSILHEVAEDNEFFLATVGDHVIDDFIHLLKAYSIFKKWQRSTMRLIILLPKEYQQNTDLLEKLETYKFRDTIAFVNESDEETQIKLYQSAFALLHVSKIDGFITPIYKAIHTELPVVHLSTKTSDEILQQASFKLENSEVETLGQMLNTLYKMENLIEEIRLKERALKDNLLLA